MDSKRTAKLLSLYQRGVVTTPEITNAFLVDLIADHSSDSKLPSFLAELPDEVQKRLRDLLREIQRAGYRWKPFMIGPGDGVLHSEADNSVRLRRLCVVLGIIHATVESDSEPGMGDGV